MKNIPVWEQIQQILRSRKFWALLAALAAAAAGLASGELSTWQTVQATIAALAVYSTGVAIEDAGRSRTSAGERKDG